ncbi:hypothetical protein B0H16DRAFT_1731424 [Mycena metata]|uniref:Uncharacterized protein n=1 Tax=Mycena metata TaxID=1033252 RepID=A0AAD7I4W0_9AGAR|nr:hypothetical protein B0H16DRAFT_1731424 [Mycena metata]
MKNESTNNSKSISSCDFQPVPFQKARPASSSSNTTTGDKDKEKDERERQQTERETMRSTLTRATVHPLQRLRLPPTWPSYNLKLATLQADD